MEKLIFLGTEQFIGRFRTTSRFLGRKEGFRREHANAVSKVCQLFPFIRLI